MEEERSIRSQRVFQGRILWVRVDTVALPGGGQATREIVEHGDSVVIVPVTPEGEVVLVRQYRKAPEMTMLEAPAGGVEAGESPEEAVARELREETGYTAERLVRLGGFWMTPGFCTEYMHAYLVTGLRQGDATPEYDENIQVELFPVSSIPQLVRDGEVQDAKSVAALLMVVCLYEGELG